MSQNTVLIQRAGEAVKAGDKQQARALLLAAIRQDARDHIAWLGLARLAESPRASLDYARRANRLRPDDPLAQKVLAWAEKRVRNSQQKTVNQQRSTIRVDAAAASDQPPAPDSKLPSPYTERPTTIPWRTAVLWIGVVFIILSLGGIGFFAWNARQDEETTAGEIAPPDTGAVALAQVERDLPASNSGVAVPQISAATATPTPQPTRAAIQPKAIAQGKGEGAEPRATWTITPTPTNTPTPTPTPIPTFVSPNNQQPVGRPFGVGPDERWVDVNLSTQSLTAYQGNTAVMNTFISSGLPSWPTVTGQFRIWLRYESQTMDGSRLGYDYFLTGVPFVMYFYQDYALHGTYWHSNFGSPMSHGCVNMYTPDAQWLFNWTSIGTVVNVHY